MRTLAFAILTLVPLGPAAAQSHEEFVSDYCLTCHNDVSRTGGLSLEAFDAADNARLLSILRTQVELGRALRRGERLERENELLRQDSVTLVAESEAMKPVVEIIQRVGPSDANVLLTGENGTGKGVVARTLHAASRRAGKPMVTVNVGGLSEGVFESELFGHV
ncbi:MAG TPA: sigma 54-interacting transcriptional regulator, partial [Vicinamibacteria bacterium]|nr:sigma 54-interacting transcriptional regulator [Vicinamibacteria bacterium]